MNEQEFDNKLKTIKAQATNEISDSLKLEILFKSLEKTSNFADFRELVFGKLNRYSASPLTRAVFAQLDRYSASQLKRARILSNKKEFYNKLKTIKAQTTNEINDSLKLEILFECLEKKSNFAEFRELVFGKLGKKG